MLLHLVRPARGGAAAVVIVFALLLFIAAKAGFIGIPLALLLTSWFFKYAYILFDHTARGFDEPPVLDIQMMNPVDEQRPLGQLVILGLIYGAVKLAQSYLGETAAIGLGLAALLLLPASAAVLGLEGSLLKAANPLGWIRMVRGLGPLYAAVLLVILGYALGLALLSRLELWLPLQLAIGMFAVLSVFSFLGGALYERRDELGIDAWASPERSEERRRAQQLREDERIVTEAYGLMRAGAHIKSWQLLHEWVSSRGNAPEDYRWLCERVSRWDDPRYITRLTEERVDRLLSLKRSGEALDVVAQRLGVDRNFRPKSAASTLAIAQMAVRGGGTPRVARALLSDFAARFAGDPHVPAAQALARRLGSADP
ncbi:MAG: hypothetical protein ACLPV8_09650 [Steroidobacteraceae bacterium]